MEDRVVPHKVFLADRFDGKAYLEKYPDLKHKGILTPKQAREHWDSYGSNEGRILFLKEQAAIRFPQELPGELWGITAFFNPARYTNKAKNYRIFRQSSKAQGLKLLTVELAFDGQPFELNTEDADTLIQIRGGQENVLWQKEALLNIALKNLPKSCDKVVWVDSDIIFQNEIWVAETSKLLETYKVVQPFEYSVRMAEGFRDLSAYSICSNLDFGFQEGQKMVSLAAYWANFIQYGLSFPFFNIGYVWAARRDLLDKHFFYDRFILGGGDRTISYAFYNYPVYLEERKCYVPLIQDSLAWAQGIFNDVQGSVHYSSGTIFHLWHGNLIDRGYNFRHQGLIDSEFDLSQDIKRNSQGIWEWRTDKSLLKNSVRNYFFERREEHSKRFLIKNVFNHYFGLMKKVSGRLDGLESENSLQGPLNLSVDADKEKFSQIFDWERYVLSYPDLMKAGINTKVLALNHLFQWGVKEQRVFFTKNSEDSTFPKALPGDIWGISVLFNPSGFKNKVENYYIFQESLKRQGLKLLTVELVLGAHPFQLSKTDADKLIQIRGSLENVLWQKEALLNIALKNLPSSCDKVVWLDADLIFQDDGWVNETAQLLEKYKIVQPFTAAVRLKKGERQLGMLEGQRVMSYAYYWKGEYKSSHQVPIYHPGFAWAARRETLDSIGFFDLGILGSGDSYMAFGFNLEHIKMFRFYTLASFMKSIPLKMAQELETWLENVHQHVQGSLHYSSGTVLHLWHGSPVDREYAKRANILLDFNFDPFEDIKKTKDGIWQWTTQKRGFRHRVLEYFRSRNETGSLFMSIYIKFKQVMGMLSQRRVGQSYDWMEYIERYPDLKANGILTIRQAKEHWKRFGKKENRTLRLKD
ncbi:MAG: hypothetical protein HQL15_02700 [Candidatus Omnitrophica bacterium]|nr:hypothetical protein [Candidatus Omnitrophota bacterium]